MSFKCLAQYNRSADTEWKPAFAQSFFWWCTLWKASGSSLFFLIRTQSGPSSCWGAATKQYRRSGEPEKEREGFHLRLSNYFFTLVYFKTAKGHRVTRFCYCNNTVILISKVIRSIFFFSEEKINSSKFWYNELRTVIRCMFEKVIQKYHCGRHFNLSKTNNKSKSYCEPCP